MIKSTRGKTISYLIISIIAIVAIICASIIIYNSNKVLGYFNLVQIDEHYKNTANVQKSFAIGILAFSCVLLPISLYITTVGMITWNYKSYDKE